MLKLKTHSGFHDLFLNFIYPVLQTDKRRTILDEYYYRLIAAYISANTCKLSTNIDN